MIEYFLEFDFQTSGLWTNILTGAYSRAYHLNCAYTVLDVNTANPLVKLLNCLAIREISGNNYVHAVKYQNGHYYFLLTRLKSATNRDLDSWDSSQLDTIDLYLSRYYLADSFYPDLHLGNYGKLGKQVICFDAYNPSGMSFQSKKFASIHTEIELLCAEFSIPLSK